ncbi:hypothetical protein RW25_28730 [Bacillus sp. L_1B0_8]|nr:hypothetical protein RW25_28730 [Bacillus sp. L_1B0_8]KIQ84839.1 hypothetical protein RT27_20755 [Bacillus sp. L_1B0_5]
MLRSRDKKIIQALDLFKCMTRDQIVRLLFSDVKNPITSANFVLKRLRRDGYIDAKIDEQPYIYFPEPSSVKKTSQKIKHYLAIVDFYIGICQYKSPSVFVVEKRFGSGYIQPDIFMVWNKMAFFVEIQLSRYSSDLMKNKLKRYINYFGAEEWNFKNKTYELSTSPYVWIVSKSPYAISEEKLQIIQTSRAEGILHNKTISIKHD